ncbi:ribose ABC transporter permease [candidate division KSB3 bacterium]|uniref:Ribose ABC transporter permease n=1 Tax=candidate division KSB3 bacterium TaxID=2044937 RepID=A0A2G6KA23_9BACT|nr:MAG: ribose ABC transporter permease [candidate division KSB3 bacterium]
MNASTNVFQDRTHSQDKKISLSFVGDKLGLLIVFAVICVILSFLSPVFLKQQNLVNILLSASLVGVVSSGMTFVILSAGIDLSVGSVVALAGTTVAMLVNQGLAPAPAIMLTLLVGCCFGAINGFFITTIGVNPLITTLGTMMVFRGAAYIVSGGSAVYIQNEAFYKIGTGCLFGIQNPILVLIATFLVFYIILTKTVFGRNLYVIGGNKEAARLCGVTIRRYSYAIYIISGLMATLSGIILAGRMTSGQPTAASGLELDVVTAVVLGGTALTGGEGSMAGTILGVMIMTVFRNGLLLLNVDAFYQYIASGMLLLAAVTFDQLRHRKKD